MQYYATLKSLKICKLGELSAVYDPASGQTHILTEVSLEILYLAERGPQTALELIDAVLHDFDVDAENDPRANLKAKINELDDLGLLNPVL